MEQATLPRPAALSPAPFPPGSRLPAIAQAVRYVRDPLGFLIRFQRRYGDIFTVSFPFFGRLVYVADPALVKARLHRLARAVRTPARRTRRCSSRRSGRTRS